MPYLVRVEIKPEGEPVATGKILAQSASEAVEFTLSKLTAGGWRSRGSIAIYAEPYKQIGGNDQ